MTKRFLLSLFLSTAALVVFACSKTKTTQDDKRGGTCTRANAAECADPKTALFCRDGIWEAIPCHGPGGCRPAEGAKELRCDDAVAGEGDPCILRDHHACTSDGKRALVCRDKTFQLWRSCRGPKGCISVNNLVQCDTSLSEIGDPCGQAGGFACSVEHKVLLVCREDHWQAASSCRGPKMCRFTEGPNKADCDDSVALEGDPCDTPDERTCSVDRKSELVCKAGKYAKSKDCKRPDGCLVRPGEILCVN